MTHLQVGDVDERTGRCTKGLLTQDSHDQLSIFHDHLQQEGTLPSIHVHKKSDMTVKRAY